MTQTQVSNLTNLLDDFFEKASNQVSYLVWNSQDKELIAYDHDNNEIDVDDYWDTKTRVFSLFYYLQEFLSENYRTSFIMYENDTTS